MMRHAISFSSLLRDVHMGLVDPEEIDCMWFGCQPEHVLRSDGRVPFEVSWLNAVRPRLSEGEEGTSAIPVAALDADALATWQRLLSRIMQLEGDGWIHWGAKIPGTDETNYWRIARFLLTRGEEVWLQHRWLTAGDVVHA